MRGKKKDTEFLSSFITECIGANKNSAEEIAAEAKSRIAAIDQKIIEVEQLKVTRSKLLDVINVFDQPDKTRSNEIRALSFFKIQNPGICKHICDLLKTKTISIADISKFPEQDVIFCIKQLLELKVIAKMGNHLLRGDRFEEYQRVTNESRISQH